MTDLAKLGPTSDGRARFPEKPKVITAIWEPLPEPTPIGDKVRGRQVMPAPVVVSVNFTGTSGLPALPIRQDAPKVEMPTAKGRPIPRGMTQTEERFADDWLEPRRLAGEILWWAREPIRINLGCGAWYKIDFGAMMADRSLELFETKAGFAREASKVRFKAAAAHFPAIFRWCVWAEGKWTITTPFEEDR
jgi:hypothetical protein